MSFHYDSDFLKLLNIDEDKPETHTANINLNIYSQNTSIDIPFKFQSSEDKSMTITKMMTLAKLNTLFYGQLVIGIRLETGYSKDFISEESTNDVFIYSSSQLIFESFETGSFDVLSRINKHLAKFVEKEGYKVFLLVFLFVVAVLVVYCYLNNKADSFERQGRQIETTDSENGSNELEDFGKDHQMEHIDAAYDIENLEDDYDL